jgi:hypothetical protein
MALLDGRNVRAVHSASYDECSIQKCVVCLRANHAGCCVNMGRLLMSSGSTCKGLVDVPYTIKILANMIAHLCAAQGS